jgi:hypothetical protein
MKASFRAQANPPQAHGSAGDSIVKMLFWRAFGSRLESGLEASMISSTPQAARRNSTNSVIRWVAG